MAAEDDEQTPLLDTPVSARQRRHHSGGGSELATLRKKKHWAIWIYGLVLGFTCFLALFVYGVRSSLPTPLSDRAAEAADAFAGIHAYEAYLTQFTQQPHPVNSRENIAVKSWLDSVVLDLEREAIDRGVKVDVITNDETVIMAAERFWGKEEYYVVGSRNVIVRVRGTLGTEDAVLVNAHYDTVPTGYGATDDGTGVAVVMELLRYFIRHPPNHTIIFLFNNFEEGGLIGAEQFVKHPWFPTVKLVINLEGAGAGGRALLFRCTSLAAAKLMAAHSSLSHASPLGNDMLKLGLIKSDTDISVFSEHGKPGLDIAFYAPRSHYHTPRDNLNYTSASSVQHMGQMTLELLQALDNDDAIYTEEHETKAVYFDVIGRFMFAYSFVAYGKLNTFSMILIPVIGLLWTLAVSKPGKVKRLGRKIAMLAQGFVAAFVGLIVAVVFTGTTAIGLNRVNPLVTYGNVIIVAFTLFLSGILGLLVAQMALTKIKFMNRSLSSFETSLYGLTGFWWLLLLAGNYAGSRDIAALFFAIFIFASNGIATILYHALPANSLMRMPLVIVAQMTVPLVILLDQCFLIMDTMRHATVDGTPEIGVYALIAIPIVLLVLQLLPWVHLAGQKHAAAITTATLFVLFFAICWVLPPFNDHWSPNKILFSQEYNVNASIATVNMTAAWGVSQTLTKVLQPSEIATMTCGTWNKHQTRCQYQTNLLPVYPTQLGEFTLDNVAKECTDDQICTMAIQFHSKNSLLCRARFNVDDIRNIHKVWSKGLETPEKAEINSFVMYNLEYNEPFEFKVQYKAGTNGTTTVGCSYDEWTKGEIPAFSDFLERVDKDTTLLIRGQGLATVNYATLDM
ncbi:hypothetical protein BX666DRAFT_2155425 [Dichotomocladium elegans]|nr:hypothetical protein BX666DRAFT_2155425 [Dichotomocladium elegans]